jgi:dTDP-4-dehydrorhamnose reductase
MSMLITGANGQLGRALQSQYPEAKSADITELDTTSRESVQNFDWSGISVILNAAAYTNVDGAETAEGRIAAWRVNADAVANLVAVAAQKNAVLVHFSTDYVFDGAKTPHTEDELFSPLSVYGASKAAGDIAASLAPKHYILRTSWVIGEGKNFVRTMIGLAEKNVSPTVVADQIGRPSFTTELARAIKHLLDARAPFGTYNTSNSGEPVSWADFTRAIFAGMKADLQVTDTTTTEYFAGKAGIAPRPLNSVFDLGKLQATGFLSRDWRENLSEYIQTELKK